MNKTTYTYPAIFTKEADGGYSVRFPQLDGCYTQGDTMEEAQRMATEAMALHLFGMEEDGDQVPEPSFDGIVLKTGELVVPITAWMTPFREEMHNRAIKKTLTIPAWLNDAAEQRKVNFSQVLQSALKDYLHMYNP